MLARVFSAEPELVAKLPEVEKPVLSRAAPRMASWSQEAGKQAAYWAETWRALSRV
jgi:hypothetical protein